MQSSRIELIGILIIGALQPIIEVLLGAQMAAYYNIAAIVVVLAYVAYVVRTSKHAVWNAWGVRLDTIVPSIVPYAICSLIAIIGIYFYGMHKGYTPLPVGFWYVLALYPLWGFAQQFVLQNFVAKNLVVMVPSRMYRSVMTATIFSCAHIPSLELVLLTFVAGFLFTYLHSIYQNLMTLSVAHGILGALVFHLVLGQDQWAILSQYFL